MIEKQIRIRCEKLHTLNYHDEISDSKVSNFSHQESEFSEEYTLGLNEGGESKKVLVRLYNGRLIRVQYISTPRECVMLKGYWAVETIDTYCEFGDTSEIIADSIVSILNVFMKQMGVKKLPIVFEVDVLFESEFFGDIEHKCAVGFLLEDTNDELFTYEKIRLC